MSVVTNVILSFSIMEDYERVTEINAALPEGQAFKIPTDEVADAFVGGSKHLERPTFLAAFNYVSTKTLLAAVQSAKWDEPKEVQLFVCEQNDDLYSQVEVFP